MFECRTLLYNNPETRKKDNNYIVLREYIIRDGQLGVVNLKATSMLNLQAALCIHLEKKTLDGLTHEGTCLIF